MLTYLYIPVLELLGEMGLKSVWLHRQIAQRDTVSWLSIAVELSEVTRKQLAHEVAPSLTILGDTFLLTEMTFLSVQSQFDNTSFRIALQASMILRRDYDPFRESHLDKKMTGVKAM